MDFGRVDMGGRTAWVGVRGGEAFVLTSSPWETPQPPAGARPLDPAALVFLAPCVPSKIVGIGRNYATHAKEHGAEVPKEPLLFLKASSSLLAHRGDVELPPESTRVECEGELALVIGRRVRRWRPGGALALEDVVFGCLPADDVTARDLQRGDGQWSRGKSFDTFCPVGRVIRKGLPDPGARITTTVNGELRQEGRLSEMTFGVARLVEHVSAAMTLEPGDVILTGTPAGVTLLAAGDRVVVTIDGVEPLEHGVRAEGA